MDAKSVCSRKRQFLRVAEQGAHKAGERRLDRL